MTTGTLPHGRCTLSAGGAATSVRSLASQPAVLAAVALTLLAAVLRFVGIGHQGFWFDEGNTALLVHFSPGKMLGLIPQSRVDAAAVLLRGLDLGAGVRLRGGAPALALRARRRGHGPGDVRRRAPAVSRRIGLVTAALAACNPLLIWYSQEARSYSLLVLLSAVTLWTFANARAQPTRAPRWRCG